MRHVGLKFLTLILLAAVGDCPAAAEDGPKDIIAAQIRAQGYQCDSPKSAVQDMQASKPHEAVWILQCEKASYRVRLDPDVAAKVEPIDKSDGAANR